MASEGEIGASQILIQLFPLMLIMLLLAVIVPYVRILRRAGRSGWWVLLLLVPGFGWFILPWVIAFMRWERPKEDLERVFR